MKGSVVLCPPVAATVGGGTFVFGGWNVAGRTTSDVLVRSGLGGGG